MQPLTVVLATGIYPPDIGGPATYVRALARELSVQGCRVTVVTYGHGNSVREASWDVVRVSKRGGPLARWWRYASALRSHAADADTVYAFSSVSCGIPIFLARLAKPKLLLRLGGDFLWERATDWGCRKTLREWYAGKPLSRLLMEWLLSRFHHIVFSTAFQRDIYREHYRRLPPHSVIGNAVPSGFSPTRHAPRDPFRLLVFSRFVRFKNLDALIRAMPLMQSILLTLVGDGPDAARLRALVHSLDLADKVAFVDRVSGDDVQELFDLHEALIVPSLTDISPNAVSEARAAGLPVLLTAETGLRDALAKGVTLRDLRTPEQIAAAVHEFRKSYPADSVMDLPVRPWSVVAAEHLSLFRSLA